MRASRVFTVLAVVAAAGVACKDNVTGIPAGLEVFTATLNGANETPPVTTTATGTAIVTVLGNMVSWKVDVLTPIDSIFLGHIHRRAADSLAGNVQVNFGKPVAWFALPPATAIELAKLLAKHAGAKRVEIEF